MRSLWGSFVTATFENPNRQEGLANFLAACLWLAIAVFAVWAVAT